MPEVYAIVFGIEGTSGTKAKTANPTSIKLKPTRIELLFAMKIHVDLL